MMLYELLLILVMVIDTIFVIWIIGYAIVDDELSILDKIGIITIILWLFWAPTWIILLMYGIESGYIEALSKWWSWSWTDFWTQEVSFYDVIITIGFIGGVILGFSIVKRYLNYREKRPTCDICGHRQRKNDKHCSRCGGRL